jgi:LPPG:FO 2-phospho-L-lactate transferase
VKGFRFQGIETAQPAPGALEAIQAADAVVFCPSNPWVSIDPILAVGGLRAAIQKKVTVAVSPIIGGETVKGPAAKMFAELGITPTALAVAQHYQTLLRGFILDHTDTRLADQVEKLGMTAHATQTLMKNVNDRIALAEDVLHFIERLLT